MEINNDTRNAALLQQQYNMISQYFKNTTPYFEDLEWDGKILCVILEDLTIETYTYDDLKEILYGIGYANDEFPF
jgi:hypothetical protein